ncbi:MAG: U32 family peptidase [Desulfovibrio sp.]|nr:MAG: U32 family peptidase [Desulfovibrio sp.]
MSTNSLSSVSEPSPSQGGFTPEILAPAGDLSSFLAALAAGADAVYLGLKHFSARMQAGNFSLTDLSRAVSLAHDKGTRVYLALNTLLKPGDLESAGRLLHRMSRTVAPDALIVQDLGALDLARQAGFQGELHLSTLAALSHPAGLLAAHKLGASRVVLPRELSIDEMRTMCEACPPGLDLEIFIHGALCYCVSGRCYWSSYLGGKSGLRGRCVQPCRRVYSQKSRKERGFSCMDLSLDVLVKPLLSMDTIRTWKIEGRKKGPHYVFYTVTAYKMLRDHFKDTSARKEAESLLERALGRPSTHYGFLPQRPRSPIGAAEGKETGSGRFVGKVQHTPAGEPLIKPRFPLLSRDLLRIGFEDQQGHSVFKVTRNVPKAGRLDLKSKKHRGPAPKPGTPVFLMDRREPELQKLLRGLEKEFEAQASSSPKSSNFVPQLPSVAYQPDKDSPLPRHATLMRHLPKGKGSRTPGLSLWLTKSTLESTSRTLAGRIMWWLPPVIWPDEESSFRGLVTRMARQGGCMFVCNAPWQIELLREVRDVFAVAGPFCNIANPLALAGLAELGFQAAVISPELDKEAVLALPKQSPMPLGLVTQGWWPVGLARVEPHGMKSLQPLLSPQREVFWHRRYGGNTWIYPNWAIDLTEHRKTLREAGYALFIDVREPRPKSLLPGHGKHEEERTSTFNWDLRLL